jgi:hypothetical protein
MDKDFSELVGYLDKKFTKVDERFLGIEDKLDKIENVLETKADKADVDRLMTAIDAYAQKADTYFQEMVMLAHKVDKMDKWIHQIADKIGLRLQE